jgi:hypothetical protein
MRDIDGGMGVSHSVPGHSLPRAHPFIWPGSWSMEGRLRATLAGMRAGDSKTEVVEAKSSMGGSDENRGCTRWGDGPNEGCVGQVGDSSQAWGIPAAGCVDSRAMTAGEALRVEMCKLGGGGAVVFGCLCDAGAIGISSV